MSFTFTAFDKAILAAILGPLIALGTLFVNSGGHLVLTAPDFEAAGVAAVIAGLGVYLKQNLPTKP